jgi:hypothetical protein
MAFSPHDRGYFGCIVFLIPLQTRLGAVVDAMDRTEAHYIKLQMTGATLRLA